MSVLSENDRFRFEVLSKATLEGAIHCVSTAFTLNEPMSKELKISYDEFQAFARVCYNEIVKDELSLVAVDRHNDEVVGVRISEDFCRDPQEDYSKITPKFFPLFALLDTLSSRYRNIREVIPGKYAHMFMVAVQPEYANQGLAPDMYRNFVELALAKGYKYGVTEPTGAISQYILREKFGFDVLDEILYRDFEFEGRKPFASIKDHCGAQLMEKALDEITT